MSIDHAMFSDPAKCRAILIGFLSRQIAGLWIPLTELRAGTGWPEQGSGVRIHRMLPAVRAAARDGLIEFRSGEFCGRASVRLKVTQPPAAPAKENA